MEYGNARQIVLDRAHVPRKQFVIDYLGERWLVSKKSIPRFPFGFSQGIVSGDSNLFPFGVERAVKVILTMHRVEERGENIRPI